MSRTRRREGIGSTAIGDLPQNGRPRRRAGARSSSENAPIATPYSAGAARGSDSVTLPGGMFSVGPARRAMPPEPPQAPLSAPLPPVSAPAPSPDAPGASPAARNRRPSPRGSAPGAERTYRTSMRGARARPHKSRASRRGRAQSSGRATAGCGMPPRRAVRRARRLRDPRPRPGGAAPGTRQGRRSVGACEW